MRSVIKFALLMSVLGAGAALAAQDPVLAMLSQLDRGKWIVTMRDGSPSRAICLGDPAQLVQLGHHRTAKCRRLVIEDTPGGVTVQYTCRGNGYGRTSIRRETGTLVQIESQGIAGGRPFQFSAEARHSGACR